MQYKIALALALSLNAAANLMMKFGVRRLEASGGGLANLLTNWVLLGGLALFALNVAFYTYALSRIPISVAYPIMVSAGFAVIAVVAGSWLGERLSSLQWGGVATIVVGVWLVASEMNVIAVE
jgi:multidrug transporter EmrE-like cation transporter